MKITERNISELIPAEYNPRQLSEEQAKDLQASLKRFGAVDPAIINIHEDRKDIIVGGHQRIKMAQSLGWKTFPCVEVELDRDKERELNVRLNKNTGSWDDDVLANLFDIEELKEWGFKEDELFGALDDDEEGDDLSKYTKKIEVPAYEPTGRDVIISELYDETKTVELLEDIEKLDVSEDVKEFLRFASYRHTVFNFENIAEFYANADEKVQKLMEDSALVIIDFDDAMSKGFVRLSEQILEQYLKESYSKDD